jgi:hypothetical protein
MEEMKCELRGKGQINKKNSTVYKQKNKTNLPSKMKR